MSASASASEEGSDAGPTPSSSPLKRSLTIPAPSVGAEKAKNWGLRNMRLFIAALLVPTAVALGGCFHIHQSAAIAEPFK